MTDSAVFASDAGSVAMARRFVAEVIGGAPGIATDVVAVLVSELATNAVVHGSTDFTIAVDRFDDHVRVTVTDRGLGTPTLHWPRRTDIHGRGLQIVRELSDRWGVARIPGQPGKSVWFDVAVVPSSDGGRGSDGR